MKRLAFLKALAAAIGIWGWISSGAFAQAWQPQRNVELIVGSGPGGSFDLTVRSMQRIFESTKLVTVSTTVVNRPGGNNSVSWVYLNGHPGDGHYLALVFPTLITNRLMGLNPISIGDV